MTFRLAASHSRVSGEAGRQAAQQDRLGERAGVVERGRGLAVAAAGLDELEVMVVAARVRAACSP